MNISVIIPVYNGEETLCRAIDSVLHQTVPVAEILLIDDGSTDCTAQVVEKYGEAIRYFHYENGGLPVARNRGINRAKFEWIAFLDADDEWLPHYIESHVKLHARDPEVKWSSCHCDRVSAINGSHWTMPIPHVLQEEIRRKGTVSFFEAHIRRLFGVPSGVVVQRSVYDEVGPYDPSMRTGQDRDMWGRIALRYPLISVCPEVCWRYYVEENSLSRRGRMFRDLQLKSVCRNMLSALDMGPSVVSQYRPYGKRLFLEYLMRLAARDCFINPDTIKDAKRLFPLTIREQCLLGIIRSLPKPIALRIVDRLRICS